MGKYRVMSKKRNLNELRQVKDAVYKAPKSYKERLEEKKSISFNQEELHDFSVELIQEVLGLNSISIEEDLIYEYIKEYFD
tara:strand:- start:150 stop:392 length:243 start_codon:yes stop_codon:yes gene_type:complete